MTKKLIDEKQDNNVWYDYEPLSDLLKREADFEVQYNILNREYHIYNGIHSHLKYNKEDEEIWIVLPEFLDNEGITILDKRISPSLQGKADMWILNRDNIEIHKSKIHLGLKAYLTYFHTLLAEIRVTRLNFK